MSSQNAILELLDGVGLGEKKNTKRDSKELTMPERLDKFGLGLNDLIVATIGILEDNDVSASTKAGLIRDIYKMHGVLKENPQSAITPVTIVINDPNTTISTTQNAEGSQVVNISPILIPRELVPNKGQQNGLA